MTQPVQPESTPDGAVLTALWEDFAADLKRFIARRVQRPEDAEDILSTVFLRMTASLDSVRDSDAIVGWMYRLTRNAIIDFYRSAAHRREHAVADIPEHPFENEDENDSEQVREELARCLRPLLAALPAEQAEAVSMVDLSGVTHQAAADTAGVSLSGMKSRVQRGRARLRRELLACCQIRQDTARRVFDYEPASECAC